MHHFLTYWRIRIYIAYKYACKYTIYIGLRVLQSSGGGNPLALTTNNEREKTENDSGSQIELMSKRVVGGQDIHI